MVQKGDSLWSIANANNTTVDEIANLNDLANNTIYVGQVLQIPSSGDGNQNIPSTDTVYVVQRGDTLYSIAQKYNTTVGAIRSKNNLTSDTLSVGQILTIPGDIESTGEEDVTEDTTTTYVVKRGDSLYTIASTYGVTVDELKNANGIVGDIITVGQVLTIPSGNTNTSNLYVVQRGDSLWSIANRFGVSVNALRMINNLTSDVLSIGQTLIIP